jgi:cell division control protein 6
MKDSLILIDEEPLSETFVPTRLFHREGQLKEIFTYIRPALYGKEAGNILVTENTGTGKTSLIKWVLREHFEKKHACVNCLNCRSEHKILENVLIQHGHAVPENKPTDYLAQKFTSLWGKR